MWDSNKTLHISPTLEARGLYISEEGTFSLILKDKQKLARQTGEEGRTEAYL